MIDIVTIFKDHAETLGFNFDYGTKAMLNLLDSEDQSGEINFLLSSPLNWGVEPSPFGTGKKVATGNFLLVVKSNLDDVIYRSGEAKEDETKYINNVQPLLAKLQSFRDLLDCSNLEVTDWRAIDGYNIFDTNTDGLVVNFTVKEV